MDISGKKILFFCPRTFNYENEIVTKLKDLGADVVFRSAQPLEYGWFKALMRLMPYIGWVVADFVYFHWLTKTAPSVCDFVFIVKGEGLSPKFIAALKKKYTDAKFILYLWDSIKNVANTELKLQYFDKILSFDPDDCKSYNNFLYRPLFFLDKYLNSQQPKQTRRLFFIGTLNGDRPKVITALKCNLVKDVTFDYWLFVRSRIELWIRRLFEADLHKFDRSRLIFTPMTSQEILERYGECAAVLDIEHPKQTGLTMRTFEVIASGRKLVTTNANIASQDFYESDRIAVINRVNPVICDDFFSKLTPALTEEFKCKYSLEGWLKDIFSDHKTEQS